MASSSDLEGAPERVIVVTDELARGGGSPRSQLELARGLRAHGLRVDLVYLSPGRFLDSWSGLAGLRIRAGYRARIGSSRTAQRWRLIRNALGACRAALRLGRRRGSEIVLARGHEEIFTAAIVAMVRRAPLVVHLSSPAPPAGAVARFDLGDRFAYRSAARFMAVARHLADAWAACGLDESVFEVVPTGIDGSHWRPADESERDRLRAELGIEAGAFVVLYAGRFAPEKGLLVLAAALTGLDRARCVAVGLGDDPRHEDPELLSAVRAAAPAGALLVHPAVDDMRPWYAMADVVVVPSLGAEPFSRVALEALACARPVVASDVGGSRELLTGELATWRYPPQEPVELRARLEGLRDWRAADPGLGARCRALVTSRFALEESVARALEVFARAAAERKGIGSALRGLRTAQPSGGLDRLAR